jgi:hypothetical protein
MLLPFYLYVPFLHGFQNPSLLGFQIHLCFILASLFRFQKSSLHGFQNPFLLGFQNPSLLGFQNPSLLGFQILFAWILLSFFGFQ